MVRHWTHRDPRRIHDCEQDLGSGDGRDTVFRSVDRRVRKGVRSGQGLAIPVRAVTPDLKPDWVIVPALSNGMPEQLIRSLGRPEVSLAKAQLRKWYDEGVNIAASCIGTFILAEAGLLDNREATTTW